jgi:transposase
MVATIHARQTERPGEVVWVEASQFTHAPSGPRGWVRKGAPTKVPPPAKRPSATLVGALHLRPQRFYWQRAERGTSKIFLACLHQLHQRFPQALLIVLLDQAKMHKSRAVQRFLKQHTWVALAPLEPYSPAYNPIERFWPWLKAKGYGATTCNTIADVSRKLRQLIWHYHEGGLTSTIHFDCTLSQEILRMFQRCWRAMLSGCIRLRATPKPTE